MTKHLEAAMAQEQDKERAWTKETGELQCFEAWFKMDCPVEGANAKLAAKAAWQARASLAPQPNAALADVVDPAYREACALATALFKKHFAHKPEYASGKVVWGVCNSTAGVISQIDNMVSGLVQPSDVAALADGWMRKPLTTAQMEAGREAIFSTGNPYCPCDSKTFRKVAQWVERHHRIEDAPPTLNASKEQQP